jgi:hypothetical protein
MNLYQLKWYSVILLAFTIIVSLLAKNGTTSITITIKEMAFYILGCITTVVFQLINTKKHYMNKPSYNPPIE